MRTPLGPWGPVVPAVVFAAILAVGTLPAQMPCPAPPLNPGARPGNIFSEEQEMHLGDAVAEHVQREFHVLSGKLGWLLVETERGRLAVYKLPGTDPRQKLEFPGAVSLARFSDDGKRLLVVTSDQTVYLLDAEKW